MFFHIFKVRPLTMRSKPDGSVRLIVDMSYPHYKFEEIVLGDGIVMSVNAGIVEELETEMTSIKGWTRELHWVGCQAECLKNDWNCAC